MEFSIRQKDLSSVIQDVQRAVASHTTMPVLSGIKITAENGIITLTATDLEIGIESKAEGKITQEGSLVLPAQHFGNIVRELPAEEIHIVAQTSSTVNLNCSDSSYQIRGYPAEDFPELPEIDEGLNFSVSQNQLKSLIEEIKFAASTDENQPFLHGALLVIEEGKMELVATNSYRLACREMEFPGGETEENSEVIIPLKTLQELSRLLSAKDEEVKITLKGNHLLFSFSSLTITSRLKEGQFPNYREVIPDSFNVVCHVEKAEFLQAVRRASLIAQEDSNTLDFKLEGNRIIINSRDSKIGQAHEEVAMEKEGSDLEVSFTADYLIDVLKVLKEDKVTLNLQDHESASVLRSFEDFTYTYVLMPVQN